MRRLYPGQADEVDLASVYAFPSSGDRPWLRSVFVSSLDGAATLGGRAGGLGNDADHRLFALLRGLADVVLVGAQTVRTEHYGPVQPHSAWADVRTGRTATPPLAVVSGRLDLDPAAPLFTDTPDDARTIVITCATAPSARRRALAGISDVIVAGDDHVDPARAIDALTNRGLLRISCEGGPKLHAQIAAAGRLDELCLTVSPLLLAGPAPRIANGAAIPGGLQLHLASALDDGGYLFLRYTRDAGRPPSTDGP